MAHRLLHDPEKEGWERSDFPIVCETCLGPNPYVRMQRIDYGAECHISKRPYTKFRWRPGSDARYKSTIICQEVAKAKNVCQVCLLDLKHNLPVQVRDQLTNAVVEDIPESDVGLEYQLALKQSRGELGAQFKDNDADENENLARLTRTTPYYKRNRAQICSFFARGECKRGAECPYRHEMPQTGELAEQNIRDRYYGINDPVAKKMLRRLGERVKLDPPEDTSICTLYVGNVEPNWREGDLRSIFEKHGQVTKIRMVHNKSCAFVTYATREEAEKAAEALHDALIIHGSRCKLLWGKPQVPKTGTPAAVTTGASEGAAGPSGSSAGPGEAPDYFGMGSAAYPSMDPSLMGSALPESQAGPSQAAPGPSGLPGAGGGRGPGGVAPDPGQPHPHLRPQGVLPPGMMPPPMPHVPFGFMPGIQPPPGFPPQMSGPLAGPIGPPPNMPPHGMQMHRPPDMGLGPYAALGSRPGVLPQGVPPSGRPPPLGTPPKGAAPPEVAR